MSDSNSMWPFQEISAEEGLDINEIFGTGTSNGAAAPEANPFQVPQQTVPAPEAATPHVEQPPTSPAASQAEQTPAPQPTAVTIPPATIPAAEPVPSNPLEAAFEAKTVENAKAILFEKKPVFCHKSAKEVIEDPTMTFEELRIRKSEDFLDLEEGKNVSWSVEYGTIRKDVKDPKGTTIISMKESIERSREFLDALKKAKDKNPDCIVRPKVTMKNKGTAAYKGTFPTVEAARNSDMLGKLYARFEPAQKAWRQATYTPLGVVLGRTDPALFLYFFSYGKTVQKESMEFHLSGLMNSLDVEQKMDNGSIHGFVMSPKENREEAVAAHAAWHVGMTCGEIFPDSGIYFAAVKQATISDKLAEDIAKNMEQYAISLVRLYAEEVEDK